MTPDFIELAKSHRRRIVLPESEDSRILQAAAHCDAEGIAEIVLLGDKAKIESQFADLNMNMGDIQIVDPQQDVAASNYAQLLYELRQHKGMTLDQAELQCNQPLYYADLMVKSGAADACVAGVAHATGDVIRAALHVIGTKDKTSRLSSFFIMQTTELPTPVLFADCAINIDPDAEELADIAYQSALNARNLLKLDPKVALLSFSTNGSAKHERVDKVQEAAVLLHHQQPDLKVIGDVQFDAAFSSDVLAKKWPESNFQAPANVFVFPSLEAANIGYKIAERIGSAKTIGPILQGLAKPVNDLSRGANIQSIIDTIAVTAVQVEDT